jgi:4-amino-4-deoxy-L-arabinose transferase-like glycosyltransferase
MRNQSHTRPLWILLIATLIYWAICAVVSPVTTWDSQVYNLGRLVIADTGGFWSNRCWFSERQVIFPWAFDAVHYPFVKAGLGESIPSFLTLIGLLVIVYNLAREWYSESFALWSCLGLISMPTLIYQATSTKNDFVMVFLVVCWFYALHRYQRERSIWLLAASGLSLGFLGGSKTSGLFFCPILLFLTLFVLRRHINAIKWFVASFVVSIILFGSIETYALNMRDRFICWFLIVNHLPALIPRSTHCLIQSTPYGRSGGDCTGF